MAAQQPADSAGSQSARRRVPFSSSSVAAWPRAPGRASSRGVSCALFTLELSASWPSVRRRCRRRARALAALPLPALARERAMHRQHAVACSVFDRTRISIYKSYKNSNIWICTVLFMYLEHGTTGSRGVMHCLAHGRRAGPGGREARTPWAAFSRASTSRQRSSPSCSSSWRPTCTSSATRLHRLLLFFLPALAQRCDASTARPHRPPRSSCPLAEIRVLRRRRVASYQSANIRSQAANFPTGPKDE